MWSKANCQSRASVRVIHFLNVKRDIQSTVEGLADSKVLLTTQHVSSAWKVNRYPGIFDNLAYVVLRGHWNIRGNSQKKENIATENF